MYLFDFLGSLLRRTMSVAIGYHFMEVLYERQTHNFNPPVIKIKAKAAIAVSLISADEIQYLQ